MSDAAVAVKEEEAAENATENSTTENSAENAVPIAHAYNDAVPGAIIGTWADESDPALVVAPDKLIDLLTYLRDTEKYDFLSSVTCVDYQSYSGKQRAGIAERFDTVYHLYSTSKGGGHISLHVRVPEDEAVPSATLVYPGANLQECEIYDLYGIKFTGHPNLRRVLLWEGFNGYPMRKDWKEAYHEGDIKPFKSRHPAKGYEWQEDKLPWGKNTTYPQEWDPESWTEPVTYVPVSQAPHEVDNSDFEQGELSTESIVVNLGPHHPSTHGVFPHVGPY